MATLYPNPTSNNLTVSFENEAGDLPKDVRVYNEDQKLIFSKSGAEFQKLKDNQFRIDLQNQPRGKYFIHLHYPDGTIKKRPIILQK